MSAVPALGKAVEILSGGTETTAIGEMHVVGREKHVAEADSFQCVRNVLSNRLITLPRPRVGGPMYDRSLGRLVAAIHDDDAQARAQAVDLALQIVNSIRTPGRNGRLDRPFRRLLTLGESLRRHDYFLGP